MVIRPDPDRRAVLKALGGAGVGSARPPGRDDLRLFGEAATDGAMEVVTQQNYAYVATGDGMAVVDIQDPGRPDVVADIEASAPDEIGGDVLGRRRCRRGCERSD